MEDRTITCIQCDTEFNFTVHEQQRYERMGFDDPKRCSDCRRKKPKLKEHFNGKGIFDKKLNRAKYQY